MIVFHIFPYLCPTHLRVYDLLLLLLLTSSGAEEMEAMKDTT